MTFGWTWADIFTGNEKEKLFQKGECLIARKGCVNIRRNEQVDVVTGLTWLVVHGDTP